MTKSAQRFLTVREVATLTHVSEMTVYRMISDRELPALRLRSRRVVPAPAIKELDQTVYAPSEPLGPALLDASVIARILRVSKATIYRLIHDGELPAVRMRGRVLIPGAAIDTLTTDALSETTSIDLRL